MYKNESMCMTFIGACWNTDGGWSAGARSSGVDVQCVSASADGELQLACDFKCYGVAYAADLCCHGVLASYSCRGCWVDMHPTFHRIYTWALYFTWVSASEAGPLELFRQGFVASVGHC
jgi:hypothetical protein